MSASTTTKVLLSAIALLVSVAVTAAQSAQPTATDTMKTNLPVNLKLKSLMLAPSANSLSKGNRGEIPLVHRALFCRFDDQLDRAKIPLRMRLGSLEEVNRKERKPGWQEHQR